MLHLLQAKSATGDWNSSRSGKYCLRSKRKGWGEGSKTIAKTVTSVHEQYRSPPPRPSPGPHAKCARILRGNPPAAGAARPAGEGYFGGLPRFGLPYGNPLKVSPAAGFAMQGRGIFCGHYAGLFVAPTPTLPHGGGGYRRFVLLRFAIWQSSEGLYSFAGEGATADVGWVRAKPVTQRFIAIFFVGLRSFLANPTYGQPPPQPATGSHRGLVFQNS